MKQPVGEIKRNTKCNSDLEDDGTTKNIYWGYILDEVRLYYENYPGRCHIPNF